MTNLAEIEFKKYQIQKIELPVNITKPLYGQNPTDKTPNYQIQTQEPAFFLIFFNYHNKL